MNGDVVIRNPNFNDPDVKATSDEMTNYKPIVEDEKEEDRELSQMGLFSWRPKFLEPLNRPVTFLISFGLSNFFLVQCVGTLSIMLPTIEKVFNLSSKETGLILMANDIAGPVAGIILANYCSTRKARSIAIGMLVVMIATLFQTSTTLFAEYPEPTTGMVVTVKSTKTVIGLCNETFSDDSNNNADTDTAARNYKYYWMFIVGAFAQGLGGTPPGIAGNTYLDEIYPQSQFGIAIAVLYVISFLGFPVSLLIGGTYLSYYVTLATPEGITPADAQWIGAWWLGLLIPCMFIALFSFPIMLFPRQMPAAKKVLAERINKGTTTEEEKNRELKRSFKEITRDTLPAFKRLLKNKSLMSLICGDVFMFLQFGAYTFFPKIYAMIFRKTDTQIGQIYGAFASVGFVLGLICGTFVLKRREWPPKKLALIFAITTVVSAPFMFSMMIYCSPNTYAGYSEPYKTLNTTASSVLCNAGCGCSAEIYRPVCDREFGLTYMSPCHAGCSDAATKDSNGEEVFEGCSCSNGVVYKGECGESCTSKMLISFILYALGFGIGFAGYPANAIVYQRVVSEVDRTLAQGMRQTVTRSLGTLPAPILFGWLLDESCLIWKVNRSGVQGNCFVYDIDKLLIRFVGILFGCKAVSALFYLLSWYFYPENTNANPVKLSDIDADDNNNHHTEDDQSLKA